MMGAGSNITWKEYGAIWGRVNNKSALFESYPVSVLEEQKGSLGRELGAMFTYIVRSGVNEAVCTSTGQFTTVVALIDVWMLHLARNPAIGHPHQP